MTVTFATKRQRAAILVAGALTALTLGVTAASATAGAAVQPAPTSIDTSQVARWAEQNQLSGLSPASVSEVGAP